MGKNNLKDRFKKSIEKTKTGDLQIVENSEVLKTLEFEENEKYTDDIKLNSFLNNSANKIKKIQMTASIVLGEIFEEVRHKIGNHHGGIYVEWLERNGYNRNTALKHRRRYQLFKLCKTDQGKKIVASSTQKIVDGIMNIEGDQKFEILRSIDDGASREEIENMLNVKTEAEDKTKIIEVKETIKITDILNVEKIKGITKYADVKVYRQRIEKMKKDLKKSDSLLKDKEVELFNEDKAGVSKANS